MKILKNKHNTEFNLFNYFEYFQLFRKELIDKNYDLNSEQWIKSSFLINNYANTHSNFKDFARKILNTKFEEKQSNNHFFLKALLADKQDQYLRISYPNLYKNMEKINFKEIKIGDKNIAARKIYSNKILMNETESILKINFLENIFINLIRNKDEKHLGINFKKNIKDYFALQIVRSEFLFLDLMAIFINRNINIEQLTFFDYLFFKYIYNISVKFHFKEMQNKLKDFDYISLQNFISNDFSPLNFCMNEFNTIRLSALLYNSENKASFSKVEHAEIENIFVSVGLNNSFVFLSKNPLSDTMREKANDLLRELWDYTCLSTTLRTFLVPVNSQFFNSEFFKQQLKDEDYNRTLQLKNLFEQSEIFEKKIELLLSK